MNDNDIIELYFARAENAIGETQKKYGSYCKSVAYNILGSPEDSEECVNDTYLKLWNMIPPERPSHFAAFICAVARSIALNLVRHRTALKRGGGTYEQAYDEISECVASTENVEKSVDERELSAIMSRFVGSLGYEKKMIFMKRYYHFMPVSDIAEEMGITEEKVRTVLHRTRKKLKAYLEKEGITV